MSSAVSKGPNTGIDTIEVCEERLRTLGLSDQQIKELGDTIDVIGDILIDKYLT